MSKRRSQPERVRGRSTRKVGNREVRQRFLLVCEGEETEPNYFRAFQVPGLVIKIESVTERTIGLIKEAKKYAEQANYDQVWCIFDRDDLPAEQIHRAIELAQKYGFRVAFSNQAFELWFLLHFDYHNTAITRKDYSERLANKLGRAYAKNSETMYETLLPHQTTAIKNARRLLKLYPSNQPAHNDPSTTVHELVEELNIHRRP